MLKRKYGRELLQLPIEYTPCAALLATVITPTTRTVEISRVNPNGLISTKSSTDPDDVGASIV